MPDDKACHEDNGWHIRQVVSFRPKRPFLEGHDRKEETEDEKRRKTAEQSEKSSISPCPLARLDETSRQMVVEEVATLLANLLRHEAQDEQQRALPTTPSLAANSTRILFPRTAGMLLASDSVSMLTTPGVGVIKLSTTAIGCLPS